jgi:hypothetical protein
VRFRGAAASGPPTPDPPRTPERTPVVNQNFWAVRKIAMVGCKYQSMGYLELQNELLRCRSRDDDTPRVLVDEAFLDRQVDEG